jgi:hypothetical protein
MTVNEAYLCTRRMALIPGFPRDIQARAEIGITLIQVCTPENQNWIMTDLLNLTRWPGLNIIRELARKHTPEHPGPACRKCSATGWVPGPGSFGVTTCPDCLGGGTATSAYPGIFCPWCQSFTLPVQTRADEARTHPDREKTKEWLELNPLMCPDCYRCGQARDWGISTQ